MKLQNKSNSINQHLYPILLFLILIYILINNHPHLSLPNLASISKASPEEALQIASKNFTTWLAHLRTLHNNSIHTTRLGCREYDFHAQACVYTGLICINTTSPKSKRPTVHFLNDDLPDHTQVSSDQWCLFKEVNPRYAYPYIFGTVHWPPLSHEQALLPQQSCLEATHRTTNSLLAPSTRIKWLPSLSLADLSFPNSNHNNDLLTDLIWLLDVQLFRQSQVLSEHQGLPSDTNFDISPRHLFSNTPPDHLYFPYSHAAFSNQLSRDVNRLVFSIILRQNLTALYPNSTLSELHTPPSAPRQTATLEEAYPTLFQNDSTLFHDDIRNDPEVDLVCTARLSAGAKRFNGAHERVCSHMRQEGYKLFGLADPPIANLGKMHYPRPPKRIVILHRHINRGIGNLKDLERAMRKRFEKPYGVEVEVVKTDALNTAEDFVRIFRRAGVLITSHGSQSMGMIWMPTFSALIEIMPVGFYDNTFKLTTRSCSILYYEIQSLRSPKVPEDYYQKNCGGQIARRFNSCWAARFDAVWADLDETSHAVRDAFLAMGYEINSHINSAEVYRSPKRKRQALVKT